MSELISASSKSSSLSTTAPIMSVLLTSTTQLPVMHSGVVHSYLAGIGGLAFKCYR